MATLPAIRIEGGILGPDLIDQLLAGELPGQRAADFGLEARRNITDEIASAFADARALWSVFQHRLERLPEDDVATSVTRDTWAIPFLGLLGYELRYNPRAYEIDGLSFAVSHRADEDQDAPPVHIVGVRQELGRVPASGRPRLAPHSLVQEYLNRTEQVWGLVTNGVTLRLLRNSTFVRRQSYVEFDLRSIVEDQHFQDFAALYRLVHRTRLPRIDDSEDCLVEQYYSRSIEQGGRVREHLREGVEECIKRLANGFLRNPSGENDGLRLRLSKGHDGNDRIGVDALYRQLLRLVYRLLFLLVSEDRGLLSPDPIFREHYGIARLRRRLDDRAAFTEHDDLWRSLCVLWRVVSDDTLASLLQLAPLNGELFATQDLDLYTITNRELLEALWHLAWYQHGAAPPRRVNYAALDVEELGSVYESLLEFHPVVDPNGAGWPVFDLIEGSERRTTGSYYTPPELVAELIKSALEPVLTDRVAAAPAAAREKALLAIRVCDPACGSGHFLLAAARRMGKELARFRTNEDEPAPERVREATRDVIAHCIYGVDKNPLAVDLCRVALWLESHTGERPLTFLDHRIRCGDSLVGVFDISILNDGIPDEAFNPLEGDDKDAARALRRRNRTERAGQRDLLTWEPQASLAALTTASQAIDLIGNDSPETVRRKRRLFEESRADPIWVRQKQACDLWTAAFFQPLKDGVPAITFGVIADHLDGRPAAPRLACLAVDLAEQNRFFHWPLEFPEVFADGGFDVILSNPPWERVKLQEKEWFRPRNREIADAKNAAVRKRLIDALPQIDPVLATDWAKATRAAAAESTFLRSSGRYPLGGVGDINTYAVFADLFRQAINSNGIASVLVPNGLVTGFTYRAFLRHLLQSRRLASFYGFENEDKIFPDVHNETKFGILTMTGERRPVERPWFTAHIRQPAQIQDSARRYSLTAEEIELINPNTLNLPAFRWAADAGVAATIHSAAPVLVRRHEDGTVENLWAIRFSTMFHMANDSAKFLDHADIVPRVVERHGALAILDDGREVYPLYEGKMLWHFDHRYGTYEGQTERQSNKGVLPHVNDARHDTPDYRIQPRYWMDATEVRAAAGEDADREWFFAWRDVGPTERTFVGCLIPTAGAGHTVPLLASSSDARSEAALIGVLSSLVVDYDARQRSNRMTFYVVEQLALLTPSVLAQNYAWLGGTARDWLAERVVELSYTNVELAPFARALGVDLPPFRWQPERRAVLQAEIDAAVLHLYKITRSQAEWLLNSFTVLRKYEEADYSEFRTKRIVLEIYDELAEAIRSGGSYRTRLDPPVGDPRAADRAGFQKPRSQTLEHGS